MCRTSILTLLASCYLTLLVEAQLALPYDMLYSDSRRTSQSSYAGPQKMTKTQEFVLPNQPRLSGMAMDSTGVMYYVSADSIVFAVAANGTTLWTFRCNGYPAIWSSPALGSNGNLFFGTLGGSFYALSVRSGSVSWLAQLGTADIYSAPAMSQDTSVVYIGNMAGMVYALAASSGEILMQHQVGYSVIGIAISAAGAVIVTDSRYVYSLSPVDLSLVWYTAPIPTLGQDNFHTYPTVDLDGNIYVGTTKSYLYSISSSGLIQWTYLTATIRSNSYSLTPALSITNVLYIGNNNQLYAVSTNGSLLWCKDFSKLEGIESPPTIGSDGILYLPVQSTTLYALTPSGEVLWKFSSGSTDLNAPLFFPVIHDGKVVAYSSNGHIFTISE